MVDQVATNYKYRTFNIEFINDDGMTDETQFDIAGNSLFSDGEHDYDTPFMMVQLLRLWEQFRRENNLNHPEILTVTEVPYTKD